MIWWALTATLLAAASCAACLNSRLTARRYEQRRIAKHAPPNPMVVQARRRRQAARWSAWLDSRVAAWKLDKDTV